MAQQEWEQGSENGFVGILDNKGVVTKLRGVTAMTDRNIHSTAMGNLYWREIREITRKKIWKQDRVAMDEITHYERRSCMPTAQ